MNLFRQRIWGLKSLASFMGLNERQVKRLARDPSVPIYNPQKKKYWAFADELESWLRAKPDCDEVL